MCVSLFWFGSIENTPFNTTLAFLFALFEFAKIGIGGRHNHGHIFAFSVSCHFTFQQGKRQEILTDSTDKT